MEDRGNKRKISQKGVCHEKMWEEVCCKEQEHKKNDERKLRSRR